MSLAQNQISFNSGRIDYLFRKARRGKPTTALHQGDALECFSGFGLAGDVHAHRLSPRQILITLRSELDALHIAPGVLYENMVISSSAPESFRPGSALVTDKGVEIRLTMYCEPCKRILPVVDNLPALIHRRGILGYIEKGGELQMGDALWLVPDRYRALPESAYQKFLDFVPTIPAGKVVRYGDIAIAIGVAPSFVRALPAFIKRSRDGELPLHRIVNAQGNLLDYLPNQADKLVAEGIRIDARVDLAAHLWQGQGPGP